MFCKKISSYEIIRSWLTNVFLIIWCSFYFLLLSPLLLFGTKKVVNVLGLYWVSAIIFWLKILGGLKYKVEGKENLKKGTMLASKHMSIYETLWLPVFVKKPIIVYKSEIHRVPVFGWIIKKSGMIAINRKSPSTIIKSIINVLRKTMNKDNNFIIFPEGTRVSIDQHSNYKVGVYLIYKSLNKEVIPVAHNAGYFWPKGSFCRRRGTITFSFLKPIKAGLNRKDFMFILQQTIDTETKRLWLIAQQNQEG